LLCSGVPASSRKRVVLLSLLLLLLLLMLLLALLMVPRICAWSKQRGRDAVMRTRRTPRARLAPMSRA